MSCDDCWAMAPGPRHLISMSARFLLTYAAALVFASCSAKVNERPILAAEASGTSSEGGAVASTADASSGGDTGTPPASGSDGLSSSGALDGASIATAPSDGGGFIPCSESDGGCSVWTGYLENYRLMSGSDVVTVAMQLPHGPGTVTGSVAFGAGPLLAPPTDPNVGYPPVTLPFGAECIRGGYRGDALVSRVRNFFPFGESWCMRLGCPEDVLSRSS
jgi:hypothetical protein